MIKNFIRLLSLSLGVSYLNSALSDTLPGHTDSAGPSTSIIAVEPGFTGFSSSTVPANAGLAGMHEACRSTYGFGARMCLDIEVFKTPGLKTDSSVARGWLQPTSQLSGDNPGSLSCNGWSVNTGSAATWLTGDMQIIYGSRQYHDKRYDKRFYTYEHCEEQLPVACCK